MINLVLREYSEIPILKEQDVGKLGGRILYFDQLIIDASNFLHPGTSSVLDSWKNKDISNVFESRGHSFNAKLMLLNMVIGRKSQQKFKGYELYTQIKKQRILNIHDKLMSELDLKYGLLDQLKKRSVEEMEAFVTIPKFYNNTKQIMFKENKWEDFLYRQNFMVSNTIFTLVLFIIGYYLFCNQALLNDLMKITVFLLGILTWTGLQYYFHRFLLHDILKTGKIIHSHYVHHAFPNMRDKLTLTVGKNLVVLSLVYIVGVKIVQINQYNLLNYILGLHFFMTLYDMLHYYFHFGWEINVPILNQLRKNHMKHHYKDYNRGFGVTTTLWDWVFGSRHIN